MQNPASDVVEAGFVVAVVTAEEDVVGVIGFPIRVGGPCSYSDSDFGPAQVCSLPNGW